MIEANREWKRQRRKRKQRKRKETEEEWNKVRKNGGRNNAR
jgi:hypothetical protein